MKIGIFSKIYEGDLESVFKQMSEDGIQATQFNLTSAGLETMPLNYNQEDLDRIKEVSHKVQIDLAAISGTFNMIDPDLDARHDGIKRFEVLCEIAHHLEIPIISLCTGSKNPNSKWEWDERNLLDSSWQDLLETTRIILPMAEKFGLVLGVETEASNIVNTPQKARQYLETFKSNHLKIIMDGANLFLPHQVEKMEETLTEAFEILGQDICLAHAKDLAKTQEIQFAPIGQGQLDFKLYLSLLREHKYEGPLIMHDIHVNQVVDSIQFLKEQD